MLEVNNSDQIESQANCYGPIPMNTNHKQTFKFQEFDKGFIEDKEKEKLH